MEIVCGRRARGEDSFGYVWEPQFSADGAVIAAAIQNDGSYGMAVDGTPWETLYENATAFTLSADGAHSAAPCRPMNWAGGHQALPGRPVHRGHRRRGWETLFTNVFGVTLSPDGSRAAAEVRTNLYDFTVAVDGTPWAARFQGVWKPVFDPRNGSIVAPVRQAASGRWRATGI